MAEGYGSTFPPYRGRLHDVPRGYLHDVRPRRGGCVCPAPLVTEQRSTILPTLRLHQGLHSAAQEWLSPISVPRLPQRFLDYIRDDLRLAQDAATDLPARYRHRLQRS